VESSLLFLFSKMVCVNEEGKATFYSLRGRFPPSLHMEILAAIIKKIRMIFPLKIGQPGRLPGSADPRWRLRGSTFL
jgi:hypothetical protein